MRSFTLKFLGLGIVLLVVAILYYRFNLPKDYGMGIQSPLPEILTKTFPNVFGSAQIQELNLGKVKESSIEKPEITARSALSYDLTSGKLLYERNVKTKIPMASLTKIMTAIITLENYNLDQEIEILRADVEVGENSMGASTGETLKVEDLMYGLMLHSGNDAAEALARASPFGRENFIYLMNKKAEDLGLSDTHFTNPTGLEGDGKQYSTAYDLLVMTKYALENPTFTKVVSTVEYEIPYTSAHKYIYLFNETNLLTSYPGVRGVKTGYTFEAGLCLVTYLQYEGHKIVAVLLNSQSRREEMKELLDYSLKTIGVKPPPHP